jgi:hypothetical protein
MRYHKAASRTSDRISDGVDTLAQPFNRTVLLDPHAYLQTLSLDVRFDIEEEKVGGAQLQANRSIASVLAVGPGRLGVGPEARRGEACVQNFAAS